MEINIQKTAETMLLQARRVRRLEAIARQSEVLKDLIFADSSKIILEGSAGVVERLITEHRARVAKGE